MFKILDFICYVIETKMVITEDLKKLIEHGDWQIIARLYNEKHITSDRNTVSPSYVMMVVTGQRAANPGTAAFEIISIAEKYLQNKHEFRKQITSLNN